MELLLRRGALIRFHDSSGKACSNLTVSGPARLSILLHHWFADLSQHSARCLPLRSRLNSLPLTIHTCSICTPRLENRLHNRHDHCRFCNPHRLRPLRIIPRQIPLPKLQISHRQNRHRRLSLQLHIPNLILLLEQLLHLLPPSRMQPLRRQRRLRQQYLPSRLWRPPLHRRILYPSHRKVQVVILFLPPHLHARSRVDDSLPPTKPIHRLHRHVRNLHLRRRKCLRPPRSNRRSRLRGSSTRRCCSCTTLCYRWYRRCCGKHCLRRHLD